VAEGDGGLAGFCSVAVIRLRTGKLAQTVRNPP